MTNARASDRTRSYLKALIEFGNGATKLDCIVKNISATGARIDVTAAVSIPKEFNLNIPHRGEVLRSQMVWREHDAIGVRFLSTPTAPEEPRRSDTHLEAENARLRLRVRELTRRLESLGQDPFAIDPS